MTMLFLLVCPDRGFFTSSLSTFDPLSIDSQVTVISLCTNHGILCSFQLPISVLLWIKTLYHSPDAIPSTSSQKYQFSTSLLLSHKCAEWEENKTKDRALGNTNIHQNLHGGKRRNKVYCTQNSRSLGQSNTQGTIKSPPTKERCISGTLTGTLESLSLVP